MKALVLGGGIIGLNVALQLQAQGHAVTLVEPQKVRQAASYGNAGHIATEQIEPLASMAMVTSAPKRLYSRGGALALPLKSIKTWLPFSLRLLRAAQPAHFAAGKNILSRIIAEALPAWRRRVADLGRPELLREDGHFVVWESPETASAGAASWRETDTGQASVQAVTEKDLQQLSALTSRTLHGAVRFSGTGQISDPAALLKALEETFVARGGRCIFDRASQILLDVGVASVRLSGGEVLTADHIIVCAGVWSKGLLEPLGLRVPIVAERGYHIQSAAHNWPQDLPPVVFEDRSMIVTRFDGGLRAASFVEIGRVDDPADPGKWARLRRHVTDLALPFGDVKAAAEWMGARPTLPDYIPAIGRVASAGNLYYAFGHQHLGLTLGPVTGERVADMVRTGAAPAGYSLDRFQ